MVAEGMVAWCTDLNDGQSQQLQRYALAIALGCSVEEVTTAEERLAELELENKKLREEIAQLKNPGHHGYPK
jgi:hypothetical protein